MLSHLLIIRAMTKSLVVIGFKLNCGPCPGRVRVIFIYYIFGISKPEEVAQDTEGSLLTTSNPSFGSLTRFDALTGRCSFVNRDLRV